MGVFDFQISRNGKVRERGSFGNLFFTEGFNYMLDSFLGGASLKTQWYMGLISATSFSTVADTDTIAAHPGWTEFVNYKRPNRAPIPDWDFQTLAVPSSLGFDGSVWRTTSIGFPIFGGANLGTQSVIFFPTVSEKARGIFITDAVTKNSATGTILAATGFATEFELYVGDVVTASYRVQVEVDQDVPP